MGRNTVLTRYTGVTIVEISITVLVAVVAEVTVQVSSMVEVWKLDQSLDCANLLAYCIPWYLLWFGRG